MRARKILVAFAASIGLLAPVSLLTAPAAQATNGCVNHREFFYNVYLGDTTRRVHDEFDTKGWLIEKRRSGRNGRLLDVWRGYRSCDYRADDLYVNFDDYTWGARTKGGKLRVYEGEWHHYCIDYEDVYDEWYDDWTGEWVEEYLYSYCYDRHWQGEYYDDPAYWERRDVSERRAAAEQFAKAPKVDGIEKHILTAH